MIQRSIPHCSWDRLRIWASSRQAGLLFLRVHWQTMVEIRLDFVEVWCFFRSWRGLVGTSLASSTFTLSWKDDLLLVTLVLVVYYLVELLVAIRGLTGDNDSTRAWLRLLHEVLLARRRRSEFVHLLTLVWLLSLIVSRSKRAFFLRALQLFIGCLFLNTLLACVLLEQLDKLGAFSSFVDRHSAILLSRVRTAHQKILFSDSHINVVGQIVTLDFALGALVLACFLLFGSFTDLLHWEGWSGSPLHKVSHLAQLWVHHRLSFVSQSTVSWLLMTHIVADFVDLLGTFPVLVA